MLQRNVVASDFRSGTDWLPGASRVQLTPVACEAARNQRRTEAAVDEALAESFPASDPPAWTSGIAQPAAPRPRTADVPPVTDGGDRRDVGDAPLPDAWTPTLRQILVSLAGVTGIALLVPLVVLLVGMPVALAVRGVLEAAQWLLGDSLMDLGSLSRA